MDVYAKMRTLTPNHQMKTKFTTKSYWRPTPYRMRLMGDVLLAISTAFAGAAMLNDYPTLGIVVQLVGVVGKFLTNFSHTEYGS